MQTLVENIPIDLTSLPRWVCANGTSKRPMKCYERKPASVTKPDTWGDFDEVVYALTNNIYEYAGFVFADDGFVGIDIDHAFDDGGMLKGDVIDAIQACKSYTEISKSGRGIHIICKGDLPFKGKTNGAGWEIYKNSRYFVLTGRTILYKEIVPAQKGINAILAARFKDEKRDKNNCYSEIIWSPQYAVDTTKHIITCEYPPVDEGNRHLSMVSFCGSAYTAGACEKTLLTSALKTNDMYFNPPLAAEEITQIVKSVMRYKRG